MLVLVMSDIHGAKRRFEDIVKQHENANYFISLGDSELKHKLLEKNDIIAIKGNYPFDKGFTYEHVMDLMGRRLLLTHGHRYRVRSGYDKLYYRMLESESVLALHGHTHIPGYQKIENRYVLNPGSVAQGRSGHPDTYMLLEFGESKVEAIWKDASTHETLNTISLDV